jgi:pimeloyl-ACP methyl ester carboxylesterase
MSRIVFLPGLWGGDEPFILDELPAELARHGVPFTCVPPLDRAPIIDAAEFDHKWIMENFPGEDIHLIGHSMGGLIGRYLISHVWACEPSAYRIRSFTSVASPHLGTPLGDDNPLLDLVHPAISDMGYAGVRKYNTPGTPEYSPPHPLVQNYSWGAAIASIFKSGDFLSAYGFMRLGQSLRKARQNPANDGVVPTFSQSFGKYLGTLAVNHKYFSVESSFKSPDVTSFYVNHFKFLEMEKTDIAATLGRNS